MGDRFLGLRRPGRGIPALAAASPVAVSTAAASAQEHWAEVMAERLTCLDDADREVILTQLKNAGIRAGLDFTGRFAVRVFSSAFWSGVIFASVIGVVLWGMRIPSRHGPAATTAAAYLLIVLVAAPACRNQTRPILSNLQRISSNALRNFLKLYLPIVAMAVILYCVAYAGSFNSATKSPISFVFYLQESAAFAVLTSLGIVIAYLALAYSYAGALGGLASTEAIGWAGTLAATAFTAWLPAPCDSRLHAGNRHFDSGMLRLLDCTITINDLSHEQTLPDSRTIKSVILDLELAAADIEQYAVSRVPRTDTATRRQARLDGFRLASVIRRTKAPVARAVHPTATRPRPTPSRGSWSVGRDPRKTTSLTWRAARP